MKILLCPWCAYSSILIPCFSVKTNYSVPISRGCRVRRSDRKDEGRGSTRASVIDAIVLSLLSARGGLWRRVLRARAQTCPSPPRPRITHCRAPHKIKIVWLCIMLFFTILLYPTDPDISYQLWWEKNDSWINTENPW